MDCCFYTFTPLNSRKRAAEPKMVLVPTVYSGDVVEESPIEELESSQELSTDIIETMQTATEETFESMITGSTTDFEETFESMTTGSTTDFEDFKSAFH